MDASDAARIRRLIQESRDRIAISDAAVKRTQRALAEMRESLERDQQWVAQFKEMLDGWRTLEA